MLAAWPSITETVVTIRILQLSELTAINLGVQMEKFSVDVDDRFEEWVAERPFTDS